MGVISEIKNDLDKGALRLLSEYRGLLLNHAKSLVSLPEEAEDLVFCTIERVLVKSDTYDSSKGDLLTWMKAIMTNLHRDGHRRKLADAVSYCPNEELAEAADESAADAVLANSDDEYVRQVVASLPPELREVIVLQYFAEQPVAKVAKILAIPPGTVASRVHLAKKILLKKLGPEFGKVKKPLALLGALLLGATALFGAYQTGLVDTLVEKWNGSTDAAITIPAPVEGADVLGGPRSADNNTDGRFDLKQENATRETYEKQDKENDMNIVKKTVASIATAAGLAFGAAAESSEGADSIRLVGDFGRRVLVAGASAKVTDLSVVNAYGVPLPPEDYSTVYENNSASGTATVRVTVNSGALSGAEASQNFEIVVLPAGLAPVEWIGSTGAQWIDTGVVPTKTGTGIDMRFGQVATTKNGAAIFAQKNSNWNYYFLQIASVLKFEYNKEIPGFAEGRDYHLVIEPL